MKKKLFSILLSLAMVITMMPAKTAYAISFEHKLGSVHWQGSQNSVVAGVGGALIANLDDDKGCSLSTFMNETTLTVSVTPANAGISVSLGTLINFNISSSVPAGEYTVTFSGTGAQMGNVKLTGTITSTFSVVAGKTDVNVSGVSMNAGSYTYGDTVGYTGTPTAVPSGDSQTVSISDWTYKYYKKNQSQSWDEVTTPTDAGEYKLVVSTSDDAYAGKQEIPFTIGKKTATLVWAEDDFTYNGTDQASAVTAKFIDNDGQDVDLNVEISANGGSGVANEFKNVEPSGYTATVRADANDTELGSNYQLPAENTKTYNMKKAPVTVNSVPVADKEYDGETSGVSIITDNVTFNGRFGSDVITISGIEGTYANAGVSDAQTVNLSGTWVLGGADVNNYQLATSGQPTTTTGKITPKVLNITREPETQNVIKGIGGFTAPTFHEDNLDEDIPGTITYTYNSENKTKTEIETALSALPKETTGTINYSYAASGNFTGTITGSIQFTIIGVEFKVGANIANSSNAVEIKTSPTYGDTWAEIVSIKSSDIDASIDGVSGSGTYSLDVSGSPNAGDNQSYSVLFNGTIGGVQYTNITVLSGTVNIAKANQTAPSQGEGYSLDDSLHITVNDGYEVSETSGNYTTTVTTGTQLTLGNTYYIRKTADNNHNPSNEISFVAVQTYDITYKDQGDVAFSGTHVSGYPTTHTYGTATNLKSATKSGYTFKGWHKQSDCSDDAITSIGATDYTDNITLYAKWVENSSQNPPSGETTDEPKPGDPTNVDVSKDVKVEKSTETGQVEASVDLTSKVSDIVKNATETKSKEVVIDAVAKTTEEVDKADVIIPAKLFEDLSKVPSVENITVQTNVAEITFDKETAKEIATQSPDGATITVEAVREDEESTKLSQDVYELKVIAESTSGQKIISNFKGGKVTVKVDIPTGLAGKEIACLYRSDKGVYTRRAVTKQDNTKGWFSFTTNHFSDYVVTEETIAQKLLVNQTNVTQNKLKAYKGKKIRVSFKKATWDKELGKKVTVYQIYRSTKSNKNFKRVKTLTYKKKATTINYYNKKGLKKGKKYYYKVRGRVKLSNGNYAYTKWSSIRSVRCK